MKPKRVFVIGIFIILFTNGLVMCQSPEKEPGLLLIRADRVRPSQTETYEMALMEMHDFLTENKVEGFTYFTHMKDDYNFLHYTAIDHLGELDKGIFEYIKKRVNKPELELIWNDISESIDYYHYYVIRYHHELSYIPEEDKWHIDNPYRKWSYYYFAPGNEKEIKKILGAWRDLYKNRGIKNGYRIFSGVIGLPQPLFIFSTWAADPLDYHLRLKENLEILGEEGAVLWEQTLQYVQKVETFEGWFLPQYSYTGDKKLAIE
jgi:hypothetical protein